MKNIILTIEITEKENGELSKSIENIKEKAKESVSKYCHL